MKFPQKAINRFNAKVNITNECHVWNAARQKQGYGMFSVFGKSMPAHRFSYLLHNGTIAENMVVHQSCENNGCVNPEHLVLQTKSQNKKSYTSVRVSRGMIEKEIDALLLLLSTEITKEEDDFGFESESKKKEYL